ncbi:alpha/beta hydrolase [Erythrobacter rubeus]|uniref:Alpha/beta hydrolase n=1 Tax=Erythrobacter rubeus TaxID=2760803 RepID=A0ABR8KP05_9SPHN|nr:alpha/beta hydrolase [Erythrobacter rubeus]MBD2842438.1 alpha/beta hydrolase [Erythrobacter rubeus]
MKYAKSALAAFTLAALAAGSIFAQQRERPSRECIEEITELCGRDRAKIRACVRENAARLSDECSGELRERVQQRREAQSGPPPAAQVRADNTVIYGNAQRQQIDVFEPECAVDELPLVLHIHGGGWSAGNHKLVQSKPAYFTGSNYYFASTGYRLLPGVTVEDQAADIGAAIQALRGQASAIGFDANRIVVMGHSAGAHLAALIGTEPKYAGDAFAAIRGVILLDAAAYDIPKNIAEAGPRARNLYVDVFGDDPARQRALSPLTYVGGDDAPNWLALYVEGRENTEAQAKLLASELTEAGKNAQAVAIPDTDHGRLNREIGTEAGSAQNQAIDAFLEQVFG